MLLSDREIQIAIEDGDLRINPLPEEESGRWQPASIDLRLDTVIWVPKEDATKTISDLEEIDIDTYLNDYFERVNIGPTNGFVLNPGSFLLGRTLETVGLSKQLSGRIEGRSRLARVGIGVHITAPKIDPGFNNPITLEIFHHGKVPVLIPRDMVICTLLVERLGWPSGRAYQGIFQGAG